MGFNLKHNKRTPWCHSRAGGKLLALCAEQPDPRFHEDDNGFHRDDSGFNWRNVKTLFLTFVMVLISSCSEADPNAVYESQQENFAIELVADGLSHPWSVTFIPGGGFLVTQRSGQLFQISERGEKQEITGVPPVFHAGQGGLLDVALDPDFRDGGWVYFSYAATAENDDSIANTEIARGRLNLTQGVLRHVEVLFRADPKTPGANHYGSRLLFAPDGTLFATLGERFNYMDEAQNPGNHLGTIIRINPDGSIPEDNPFVGHETYRPEIFSYGHRNPQGIALHPETGAVWIHEHGPKGGDEINILKSGANYGWPAVTFGISYWGKEISDKTTAPGMEDQILHWTPSIAPSGMAFYTDDAFDNWKADLFVGALVQRHLRRLELDENRVVHQEELLLDRNERIRDVRAGPDGYLYILTDEPNGKLYRLKPAS